MKAYSCTSPTYNKDRMVALAEDDLDIMEEFFNELVSRASHSEIYSVLEDLGYTDNEDDDDYE